MRQTTHSMQLRPNNIIIDFKYVEDNQHIFLNDQDVENEIRSRSLYFI